MVLMGVFQIVNNCNQAWEQEYRLARDYYTWACDLPIHYPDSISRLKDARERLDRATYRMAYE